MINNGEGVKILSYTIIYNIYCKVHWFEFLRLYFRFQPLIKMVDTEVVSKLG